MRRRDDTREVLAKTDLGHLDYFVGEGGDRHSKRVRYFRLAWPFEPDERPEIIEELRPMVSEAEHPYLIEVMAFAFERGTASLPGGNSRGGYDADFAFGLELVLDGLDRARASNAATKERGR